MTDDLNVALQKVERLYSDGLREKGATSPGVGWPDPKAHQLRFEKLASLVEGTDPFTVNDLGCGYGAFADFLDTRFPQRMRKFHGYDISQPMVDEARRQHPDPRHEFHTSASLTETADYSFACGIFNVRFEADDAHWREHIRKTVMDLANHSRRGFAFNALTTYVDWKKDHLYYADPLEWFDFCKRNVSRSVALLHDSPLYEWTILVRTDTPRRV